MSKVTTYNTCQNNYMAIMLTFLVAAIMLISSPALASSYEKPTMTKSIKEYYGYHNNQFNAGVQWDVDVMASKHRNQVYAPMDGTVKEISENDALGKFIVIQHTQDLTTLFGHLGEIDVKEGDVLYPKQLVAKTAPAETLYHEVTYKGVPLDPSSVIGFEAADFQYLYVEAVDEIERGPYMLISDLDFDKWEDSAQISFAVTGDGDAGPNPSESIYCNDRDEGDMHPDNVAESDPNYANNKYCCPIYNSNNEEKHWVTIGCNCGVYNQIAGPGVMEGEFRTDVHQSSSYAQPPSSILDMMCWDELVHFQGQSDAAYQGPSPLFGPTVQTQDLLRDAQILGRGYIEGQWGDLGVANIPGLAVYGYMRVQEFLDNIVDAINDAIRGFVASILNSVTGGFLSGLLGLDKEFSCDMMYRLWNVAEDCFDLEMFEIGDVIDRIELPGLNCGLEAFAYGGKGMEEVRDYMATYEPGGINYEAHFLDLSDSPASRAAAGFMSRDPETQNQGWDGTF